MSSAQELRACRPTLTDVSKLAGVTVSAVSHVLNRRHDHWIGESTRKRVMAAVKELGYRPNMLARNLRLQQTRTFGLIFPGMENDHLIGLVQAIYREARRRKYHVLLDPEEGQTARAHREAMGNMVGRAVEGVMVLWPYGPWHLSENELLPSLVLIDTDAELPPGVVADHIRLDRAAGIEQATTYLLDHGRQAVCLVVADVDDRVMRERLEGWRRAHELAGLTVREDLIFRVQESREWDGEWAFDTGRRLMAAVRDFDAVVAASDYWAVGIMEALSDAGKRVPQDVAVVGFHDHHICMISRTKLASVGLDVELIAKVAIDRLIARPQSPGDQASRASETMSFPMRFIPRASSGEEEGR